MRLVLEGHQEYRSQQPNKGRSFGMARMADMRGFDRRRLLQHASPLAEDDDASAMRAGLTRRRPRAQVSFSLPRPRTSSRRLALSATWIEVPVDPGGRRSAPFRRARKTVCVALACCSAPRSGPEDVSDTCPFRDGEASSAVFKSFASPHLSPRPSVTRRGRMWGHGDTAPTAWTATRGLIPPREPNRAARSACERPATHSRPGECAVQMGRPAAAKEP